MKTLKIINVYKSAITSAINFGNYRNCIYFSNVQWLRFDHTWFDNGDNKLPIQNVFIDLMHDEQSDVLIFINPFNSYSFAIRSDF